MSAPPLDVEARRRRREVAATFATAALHLVFQELLGHHAVFVVAAVLGWGSYVYRRARQDPGVLARWGFRRENLAPSFAAVSVAAAVGIADMALIAANRGQLRLHWHMLIALVLYPVWGTIQQLLVQGLVAANLARTEGPWSRPPVIVLTCAALFALVHAPGHEIMIATFLLGCAFTPAYLRWRNLWPLGLYHGWLGLFFYFWVRGTNPVASLFR